MAHPYLQSLLTQVWHNLGEETLNRYKWAETSGAGASDGSTIVSDDLIETDHWWNGCEAIVMTTSGQDDVSENTRRVVEYSLAATNNTLYFPNNRWPTQVISGNEIELFERNENWSAADFKQWLIDSINFLASVLPKSVLRDYVVTESVNSTAGVADPPGNAIDIVHVTINGKPAVPVPVERASRLIAGNDVYLPQTTSNRYLYILEGKDATNGQLRHAPAVNATVVYHKIPLMTEFSDDANRTTTFPTEFHTPAVYYATGLAWLSKGRSDLAQPWMQRCVEHFQSKGIKIQLKFQQEYQRKAA